MQEVKEELRDERNKRLALQVSVLTFASVNTACLLHNMEI